jgi:heme exporter protein A
MSQPIALDARSLACIRGERLLFRGLDLAVSAGEGVELVGPNGIGKTSLLRILAKFAAPSEGSVTYRGVAEGGEAAAIEFMGVRDGLKAALTAEENLRFAAGYSGASLTEIPRLLKQVGLSAQAALPVAALSSGQRRRLALARAKLHRRPILLLDEPLNALDEEGRAQLCGFLDRRLREGAIAIVASHIGLGLSALRRLTLGETGPGAS